MDKFTKKNLLKRNKLKKIQSQNNDLYKHLTLADDNFRAESIRYKKKLFTIEMSITLRLNSINFAMAVYKTHFHQPEMKILLTSFCSKCVCIHIHL